MYTNEVAIFFNEMIDRGLKVFNIKCEPNHSVVFVEEDYTYFKKNLDFSLKRPPIQSDDDLYKIKPNLPFPENLKFIRESQSQDLFIFYNNLIFESFFVISKIKDNCYYFDLLVVVKNDFDLNNFLKTEFKLIKIVSVEPIYENNISYSFFKYLLNPDDLKKYLGENFFYEIREEQHQINIYNPLIKKTKEYIQLQQFFKEGCEKYNCQRWELMGIERNLYEYYNHLLIMRKDSLRDQKVVFDCFFKNFGWLWITLDYYFADEEGHFGKNIFTYPINNGFFFAEEEWLKPTAIIKQNGEIKLKSENTGLDGLDWGGMIDLVSQIGSEVGFVVASYLINVPKFKYNTHYKEFLKLNNNKK